MNKNGIQVLLLAFAICLMSCKNSRFSTNGNQGSTGTPGSPLTDVIEITQSLADPMLDILIVIDTSGSMEHHQQKLGDKLGKLIDNLDGIDWQIAFTSTDNSGVDANGNPVNADGYHGVFYNLEDANGELDNNGEKIKILNADFDDPNTIFLNTVNRDGKSERYACDEDGECGYEDTGTEAPLMSVVNAIKKREQENAGFFRSGATLATIILSNEDEFSDGQPEPGTNSKGEAVEIPATTPQDVINSITEAFGSHKKFVAYGIIIERDNAQCLTSEGSDSGTETPAYSTFIEDLATATNGKTGSICDTDYTENLTEIGEHLEAQLTLKEVPLNYQPTEGKDSITMTFTPIANTVVWTWNAQSNVIEFETPPAEGTHIRIEYEHNGMK